MYVYIYMHIHTFIYMYVCIHGKSSIYFHYFQLLIVQSLQMTNPSYITKKKASKNIKVRVLYYYLYFKF